MNCPKCGNPIEPAIEEIYKEANEQGAKHGVTLHVECSACVAEDFGIVIEPEVLH